MESATLLSEKVARRVPEELKKAVAGCWRSSRRRSPASRQV